MTESLTPAQTQVPLGSFATVERISAPLVVARTVDARGAVKPLHGAILALLWMNGTLRAGGFTARARSWVILRAETLSRALGKLRDAGAIADGAGYHRLR